MAYGDKRDYKKIDIFVKNEKGELVYACSTTWAKTCKEAKQVFYGYTQEYYSYRVRWPNVTLDDIKCRFANS